MDTIVTEIKDVTDIIPQVSLLSQEVVNLVKYLPKGMAGLTLRQSYSDTVRIFLSEIQKLAIISMNK